METGSENNPTSWLRNSSQNGNGPKGKMRQQTDEKIEKRIIPIQITPLIDTIHNVGAKSHYLH